MAELKAGKYAPIYILCGEEPYYIDRVYDFIAENALDEMAREFDHQVVYGRDLQGADIAPVVSAARGYAMMGGRKVVIVREAQTVKKWEALEAYLAAVMPQTVLVICFNGKPDKRQNIWKKIAEHPQVVWMQRLYSGLQKRTSRDTDRSESGAVIGGSYRYGSLGYCGRVG